MLVPQAMPAAGQPYSADTGSACGTMPQVQPVVEDVLSGARQCLCWQQQAGQQQQEEWRRIVEGAGRWRHMVAHGGSAMMTPTNAEGRFVSHKVGSCIIIGNAYLTEACSTGLARRALRL
jgi:hypothetical protein